MNVTYPLFGLPGSPTSPSALPSALYDNNERGGGGFFGVGANRFWHGGIHLCAKDVPIRAIADGHVVAYRMNDVLQEADLADGHPARKFSSGFVLIKHKLVTPKGGEIPFFSLYMHLKPMTAEETNQESGLNEAPHIFKKTHYVVADSPRGSGLPVIDDRASTLKGVIPFGAHFTVHPDDDKCKNERYRKIKLLTARVKGYVVVDPSRLRAPLPLLRRSKGRIFTEDAVPILDDNLQPTGKSLPKNGFFISEVTPAQYSRLRYAKVVCLKRDPTVGFIEDFAACTERVSGNYFRVKSDKPLWDPGSGTTLMTVSADAYVALEGGAVPANHWTRLTPHNTKKFTKVRFFANAVTGFALIDPPRAVAVKKTAKRQPLEVLDATGLQLATIGAEEEYLALGERPASDSVLAPLTVCKISYPDPSAAERTEGYAFLRAGYDFMKLDPTTPETSTLHLWGEPSMTALWDNGILDATGNAIKVGTRPVELEMDQVFELLDDSSIPEGHWSRQVGWRKVSFTHAARQGQASLNIEGYAWVGSHTTVVAPPSGTSTAASPQTYKLFNPYVARGMIQHQPPETATCSYRPNGSISNYLKTEKVATKGHSYSWDGRFDGVTVHVSADEKSAVLGVLEMGTTLKLKADVTFKSQLLDGNYGWVPTVTKMQELSDGGFVYVDGLQVTKRTELPKPIEFNKVVTLATPIPIKRGDIVGFPGQTDEGGDQFHFEVFMDDHSFTDNPSADKWGQALVHIDPEAKFYVRQVKAASASGTLSLQGPSLVTIAEKDFSQRDAPGGVILFKVKNAPTTGWIASADIDTVEGSGSGTLKRDVTRLYKETVKVEKTIRETIKDEHNVDKVVERKVEVQQVNPARGHYAMNGTTGRTLKVLETEGEAARVEIVEDISGWLTKAEFESKATNVGWDAEKVYRYELSSAVTLFKDSPAGSYEMKEPTGVDKERLKGKVAALPRKRRLDKDWLEFDGKDVETWMELSGKQWLGVKADSTQTIWFDSSVARHLSPAYDWLDWQFFQEAARADDPATTSVAENTFDKDGFCDLESLLEITGAPSRRESLPKLRRFGFAHPTEWMYQTDASFNKWERLRHAPWSYEDEPYNKLLDYIKSFQWWNAVSGVPAANKVWHVHPVGFIEQLRGMFRLNANQLIEIFGSSTASRMRGVIEPLCVTLDRYQITTPLRIAHFVAQTGAETGAFALMRETGNPDYSDRPDLGNIYPGDGKTFFGRGFMQLTGRFNYEAYEKYIGEDVTSSYNQADKLAAARLAFDSAGWFWKKNGLNERADNARKRPDFEVVREISTIINGGCNGLGARLHYFKRAKYVLCGDIDS
ncbi:glycoside hydrolase family 19 protein [Vitiosangium sp. GDMCC 1.1324]|uniref:glycoside hydrolase family 19 protein n=1 Tax=Vitiosangium sp. (strain GDMCC 1.1324) TaxID=2138576 RepID=UPI00130E0121|nr:glycoside hydrolase family 19 protein [Vitiosangium sp. GDMCC 1.1324]